MKPALVNNLLLNGSTSKTLSIRVSPKRNMPEVRRRSAPGLMISAFDKVTTVAAAALISCKTHRQAKESQLKSRCQNSTIFYILIKLFLKGTLKKRF